MAQSPKASRTKKTKSPRKLAIGQVATESGLAASAIRYYEREGLLPVAPKEGGRRIYDADVLDRLAVIELAKGAGMTLAETKALLGPIGRGRSAAQSWRRFATDKRREIDEKIAQLERMRSLLATLSRCDCPTLEDCGRALRSGSGC